MKYSQWFFIIIFLILFLITPVLASAFYIYPAGGNGYDISYPQCVPYYPSSPFSFGIIGVNGGKAFTENSCLYSEFLWSKLGSEKISVYINLNYPSGGTESFGIDGPAGKCNFDDSSCRAYNYGFNAAQYAYQYALSQNVYADMWWFDIETANTWADMLSLNNQVIQGAFDFFTSEFIQAGIYSTKRDWYEIMGKSYVPMQNLLKPVPAWLGGDPVLPFWLYCSQPFAGNTQVWLVQYGNGDFDGDYACP